LQLGIEQVYTAYRDQGLTEEEFLGPRYLRLRHLKDLMLEGSSIRSCVERGASSVTAGEHRRRMSDLARGLRPIEQCRSCGLRCSNLRRHAEGGANEVSSDYGNSG
jgi:hypothetical protein